MKYLIATAILLLILPPRGLAEYFKYRDENGVLVFSDMLPEKYASQVEIYQDSVSTPQKDVNSRQAPKASTVPPPKPRPEIVPLQPQTKFTLLNNRILLPVEIVGTRGRATVHLIMDTGAQRTFLWRNALPSIGMHRIGRIRAVGIAGSKYASSVRAKSINVGPYRMQNAEVAVMIPGSRQRDYDGLLGMDFIMKVKYEIDYEQCIITWKGMN